MRFSFCGKVVHKVYRVYMPGSAPGFTLTCESTCTTHGMLHGGRSEGKKVDMRVEGGTRKWGVGEEARSSMALISFRWAYEKWTG